MKGFHEIMWSQNVGSKNLWVVGPYVMRRWLSNLDNFPFSEAHLSLRSNRREQKVDKNQLKEGIK